MHFSAAAAITPSGVPALTQFLSPLKQQSIVSLKQSSFSAILGTSVGAPPLEHFRCIVVLFIETLQAFAQVVECLPWCTN